MNDIFKMPSRDGRPGRPRDVEILGGKQEPNDPKVVGASVPGTPQILDKRSPVVPSTVDVRDHVQDVTENDGIRSPDKKNLGVEVRLRTVNPGEFKKTVERED
jgi:hypothetical protein